MNSVRKTSETDATGNVYTPSPSPSPLPSSSFVSSINWRNFLAGTVGGVVPTAIFHPLELIKIRWQVYESVSLRQLIHRQSAQTTTVAHSPKYRPPYKGMLDTVRTIYASENGMRGLYRGLVINCTASGTAWGAYFLVYNGLKTQHLKLKARSSDPNAPPPVLTFLDYTIDASLAGVSTICITNPLFLIKTRMCLQYSQVSADAISTVKYKNSWQALRALLHSDGVLGLYKGILPGLFGTLNGTVQMVTYDMLKAWWLRRLRKHDQDARLDTFHYSLFSGMSKIFATVCTYPFQLVRVRLQDQHQRYKNVFELISKTYKHEKIYGFYKGLLPCLIRVTPAASLTFIVYENLLEFLMKF